MPHNSAAERPTGFLGCCVKGMPLHSTYQHFKLSHQYRVGLQIKRTRIYTYYPWQVLYNRHQPRMFTEFKYLCYAPAYTYICTQCRGIAIIFVQYELVTSMRRVGLIDRCTWSKEPCPANLFRQILSTVHHIHIIFHIIIIVYPEKLWPRIQLDKMLNRTVSFYRLFTTFCIHSIVNQTIKHALGGFPVWSLKRLHNLYNRTCSVCSKTL